MASNIPYLINFTSEADEGIKSLDKAAAQRIIKKILWVAQNADIIPHVALTDDWQGYYRYRVGDYRFIYTIDAEQRIIQIVVVGHRRDIYDD